jgi:hypothetical protein
VRRELDSAVRYGVAILPFRIEDVPVDESLEWYLSLPHWLDALTPPLEKHIEDLAATVAILVDRLPEQDERSESEAETVRAEDEGQQRRATVDALVEQARLAMDESRYPDAYSLARQVLEIDANHREAQSLCEAAARLIEVQRQLDEARAALLAGSAAQAIESTEAALRADPGNVEAQELRAEVEGAIVAREESREDQPRQPDLDRHVDELTVGASESEHGVDHPVADAQPTDVKVGTAANAGGTTVEQVMQFVRAHRFPVTAAAAGFLLLIIGFAAVQRSGAGGPPPQPLQVGSPVSATLTGGAGSSHRWELNLPSSEDLRVELSNLAVDYDLYVTGPNRLESSSILSGTSNDVVTVNRAPSGRYLIQVRAARETDGRPYQLLASVGSALTPTAVTTTQRPVTSPVAGPGCGPLGTSCSLLLEQPVTAALTPGGEVHRWYLELPLAGELTILLTDLPDDYDLYVTGPGGLSGTSTWAGRRDDSVVFAAAPAGRYDIEVRKALLASVSSQPYRLIARRGAPASPAVPATLSASSWFSDMWSRMSGTNLPCPQPASISRPLQFGQAASAVLTAEDRAHIWTMTLPSSMDLRVELTNLAVDYDLYVSLPDGRCESSLKSAGADDVVEVRGAPAGDYSIVVTGVSDPVAQPYRLTASGL